MQEADFEKLYEDLQEALLGNDVRAGILGLTGTTLAIIERLAPTGLLAKIEAVFASDTADSSLVVPVKPLGDLRRAAGLDVLVVAADVAKQEILLDALPYIQGEPKVIVAGYGHLEFRDALFAEERAQLLVPSLANGYPNSLTHLYQCLTNAARLQLSGVVAEFGMFKGGTTAFMARVVRRLGMTWPVIGFDSFTGFPPRRSPLDMYDHPDCIFTNEIAVRRQAELEGIEVVAGDIVHTAERLLSEQMVLTFIDTDNYSSARAAIEVVQDRTVVGGAIVFDHFTGLDRFRYTVGERIAALPLLEDQRYFNLHGTGVFLRQGE